MMSDDGDTIEEEFKYGKIVSSSSSDTTIHENAQPLLSLQSISSVESDEDTSSKTISSDSSSVAPVHENLENGSLLSSLSSLSNDISTASEVCVNPEEETQEISNDKIRATNLWEEIKLKLNELGELCNNINSSTLQLPSPPEIWSFINRTSSCNEIRKGRELVMENNEESHHESNKNKKKNNTILMYKPTLSRITNEREKWVKLKHNIKRGTYRGTERGD